MGISERDFKREMNHSQAMASDCSMRGDTVEAGYWKYRQHGLRRLYHGERFQTTELHRMRLEMANSTDTETKRKGEGYRAGFEYRKLSGSRRRGRTVVGEVQIPALLVSKTLRDDIKLIHDETGESPADMRRRWEEDGCIKDMRRLGLL